VYRPSDSLLGEFDLDMFVLERGEEVDLGEENR